jgi:hypothetical protein
VDIPNPLGPFNGQTLDAVILQQIVIELIDGNFLNARPQVAISDSE